MSRAWLVAFVTLLSVPLAGAAWSAFGSMEPDTAYDDPTLMRTDPPPVGTTSWVYFAVWPSADAIVNPNLALLSTHDEAPMEHMDAMLGRWVDCNGDGYVGMAESAITEYDSRVLTDPTICPASTGNPAVWDGSSNYNGWVVEYTPVGGDGGDSDTLLPPEKDLRVIRDQEARIWGDVGVPDPDGPTPGNCIPPPFPRGTWRSTGGLLTFLDCDLDIIGTWNSVDRLADPEDGLGMRFPSDDDARDPGNPLDEETFGSDDASAHGPVKLTDCTTSEGAVSSFRLWVPNPSAGDPASLTVPGQLNRTREDFDDCNTFDDPGNDFYGGVLQESPDDFGSVAAKRASDWIFHFQDANRGVASVHPGPTGPQTTMGVQPTGFQHIVGLHGLPTTFDDVYTGWRGSPESTPLRLPRTVRSNAGAVTIDGAAWRTFYAYVGQATYDQGYVTAGGGGVYGRAECGSFTSGVHHGWDCDNAHWYGGGGAPRDVGSYARPGSGYQLRDVDCYDGNNALGIPLGLPAFGSDPCLVPS